MDVFRKRIVLRCVLAATVLSAAVLSGCVVQEVGGNLANTIKGDYYLQTDDPKRGEEYFHQEVQENPENALNNYYYGRLLLRSQKAGAALPYLQKADRLEPDNADYQFWTGVAHGSLKQAKEERLCYERALKLDPEHQQALTALGHSYLRAKQYTMALKYYGKALALWPDNPSALYNRALALNKLGKRKEEKSAWHRYLQVNPSGGLARNAADHLNALGDFSYRNYQLGVRTVTVRQIRFTGAEVAKESLSDLEMIGEIAGRMQSGVLQVVVYQKGDKKLAKGRALSIRRQLLKNSPELGEKRLGVSWFGEPQRNRKKGWTIEESVDFFLTNK